MRHLVQRGGRIAASSVAVLIAASSLGVAAPPEGSGGGAGGAGDVFADLVVAWRDANGVPLMTSFEVATETGPALEYCVQPVSYTPLPGLGDEHRVINGADGREVWRIPLMGELDALPVDEEEVEVCDPQPAYAMYVAEAELERLNMARQPHNVLEQKLAEVAIRLASADEITLDGAGRITTDGTPIDAAPDHAAMYASMMTTGTIPGLTADPAQVLGFDAWMLAAAAVGTATGKEVPLTVDAVEYYNRIVGIAAEYVPSAQWTVDFLETTPSNGERFVDFSGFSYNRSAVFTGYVTWLDVAALQWRVSPIVDVVDFAALPPVAYDTDADGVADTVSNVAGFAQLADDVRATILYLHENEVIAGFFMDPVQTNTGPAQLAALTNPAVQWGGVPAALVQTDTVGVSASLYMPWAGATVDAAQVRVTVDAATDFAAGSQVTAVAADGAGIGQPIPFSVDDDGNLVGHWGPPTGFPVAPGYRETTTFDVTVAAGAPSGVYDMTLEMIDLGAASAVLASDETSTNVLDAVLTVLWDSVEDYETQGSYVPVTAGVFNPDLGLPADVSGAVLRVTIDAPEPFTLAGQVGAWSEAVPMSFTLDSDGNLIGTWALPDPIPVPYDQLVTWWLNVAEGAPIGLYVLTVDVLDAGGVPVSTAVAEITFAPAPTHGQDPPDDPGNGEEDLPPVTSISNGPSDLTNSTSATFVFAADDPAATLACSLDAAAPAPCTSPVTLTGLAEGDHTFAVFATNSIGHGVTTIWQWTVDTTAPQIRIDTAPVATTTSTSATFEFSTTDPTATYACAIDGGVLIPCTSPATFTGLAVATHTFVVTATDLAGNRTAMADKWTVVAAAEPAEPLPPEPLPPEPLPPEPPEGPIITPAIITPLAPVRLADTRSGWVAGDGRFTGMGPLGAGQVVEVPVAGRAGIPSDATAAVLNVTISGPSANGFATVFASGAVPEASSLNYRAGQDVANELVVKLSTTGTMRVYTDATAHVIIDAVGFVPAGADYSSLAPVRLADTRPGWVAGDGRFTGMGPLAAGQVVEVPVAGRAGIPSDATAAVLNVTIAGPAANGFATVFASGAVPEASSLNYRAGQDVANELVVKLSATGTMRVYTDATAHVIIDAVGYVPAGADYTALAPVRLADTRPGWVAGDGRFTGMGPLGAGQVVEVPVAGRAGIPSDATAAVLNVTISGPAANGFATVFASGAVPEASSLNYRAGQDVANELVVKLSTTGTMRVYTDATAHVIIDTVGFL